MKIRLDLWAQRNFYPPPHRNTLRNWIKQGRINPTPIKLGRSYYVDETAEYLDDGYAERRLVERITGKSVRRAS